MSCRQWRNSLIEISRGGLFDVNERKRAVAHMSVCAGCSRLFDEQLTVTLVLGAVFFVFWFLLRKGFNRNVLALAVPLVLLYLLLTGLLLAGGILRLVQQPELIETWLDQVREGDWLVQTPFWVGRDWLSAA